MFILLSLFLLIINGGESLGETEKFGNDGGGSLHLLSTSDSSAYITKICIREETGGFNAIDSIEVCWNHDAGTCSGEYGMTHAGTQTCHEVADGECFTSVEAKWGGYMEAIRFGMSDGTFTDEWGGTSFSYTGSADWSPFCLERVNAWTGASFDGVSFLYEEEECIWTDVFTFDWDDLTSEGDDDGVQRIPAHDLVTFEVSTDDFDIALDIVVELQYTEISTADEGSLSDVPVSFVLDFEDFNAHKDDIRLPGTCSNRARGDFEDFDGDFAGAWTHSDSTADIGSNIVTSSQYPPTTGTNWDITHNECSSDFGSQTIIYSGHFTWEELRGCTANDGTDSYTQVSQDENYINLEGVFYVNVVSPYWWDSERSAELVADGSTANFNSYYRVYQIISQPFIISVKKRVDVIGGAGINVMTISIIAVYKEGSADSDPNDKIGEDVFKLVVLTETTDYMQLTDGSLYTWTADDGDEADIGGDIIVTETSSSDGCLNNKAYICSQLWEIRADGIRCDTDDDDVTTGGIDFTGDYVLQFNPSCRSESDDYAHCVTWLSEHSDDIYDGLTLSTHLTWRDDICTTLEFDVSFTATMSFYSDNLFTSEVDDSYLFAVGDDTVYVQIDTNFPTETFDVFDVTIENVWICTFPVDEAAAAELVTVVDYNDTSSIESGCLSTLIDDEFVADFYHIYDGDTIEEHDFAIISDGSGTDIVQFSFTVPREVERDTLFIHAQLNVNLEEISTRRRLKAGSVAGGGTSATQIGAKFDGLKINHGQNINKEPQQPQQPQQPQPQQPQPQPQPQPQSYKVPTDSGSYYLSLSSPWIMAIGGLLAIILTFNIIMMCYMNCSKQTRGRVSFNSNRRSGYNSVKPLDSEDFNESEADAINVVSE